MRAFLKRTVVGLVVIASIVSAATTLLPTPALAKGCPDANAPSAFLGLPYWYRNLSTNTVNGNCVISICKGGDTAANCAKDQYSGLWIIATNIVDILLRLIGLVAVLFIIWGGIQYIISQGDSGSGNSPGGIVKAKQTITRALIGLVIAMLSVLILNFVANTIFKQNVKTDTYQVGN